MELLDISQPIFGCRVYKGDTAPSFVTRKEISEGCRLSDVSMCLHNGTHIDAPSHYIPFGKDISSVDLNACFGKCTVVRTNKVVDVETAEKFCKSERILFCGALLSLDGAKALAANGVKLVGTDSQSIAPSCCEQEVHSVLLQAEVVILEGLDLSRAADGDYTLAAFPVNFNGLEAAPVRAVLIKE